MSITAQWVDEQYKLQKALLSLPYLEGSHTGDAQSVFLFNTISEFGIAGNLGYCVSDNHGANDTALRALSRRLAGIGIQFDPRIRRVRCIGHIINLAVQAFLFASGKKAMEAALKEIQNLDWDDEEEAFFNELQNELARGVDASDAELRSQMGWRKLKGLGKIHNLAVVLRSSPMMKHSWEQIAGQGHALGLDNATRWNSWFGLIKKALDNRHSVEEFCYQHRQTAKVKENMLTEQDWTDLEETRDFLEVFHSSTLDNEGSSGSLDKSLLTLDGLLRFCEEESVCFLEIHVTCLLVV